MPNNKISLMWPTYFGEFYNPDHKETKERLLDFFTQYKKDNKNSRLGGTVLSPDDKIGKENHEIDDDLYMSKYNLHLEKNEHYQKLIRFIGQSIMTIALHANKTEIKNLQFEQKNLTAVIKDSWFIDYKKGGFVMPHTHPQCSWNCVYYVQIGDDVSSINGSTFFQKARPANHTSDFGSQYNNETMLKINATEGKLVVWPQYLMHGSIPYQGNKNRIIVSANALVTNQKN